MGYSNVAGALNVFTSTSTQDLVVRGDTLHLGNITSVKGFAAFGNVAVANLVVTGNFTITATNTQTTNALTINNAGTATALKVTQSEGGGPGHTYNVAEFWDFQTLAMVIDPEGNVGIHTGISPDYALTVMNGAYIDMLTSQLFTGNGAGLSNIQVSSLVGALGPLQLQAAQTNVTSLGTLTSLNVSGTANIANGWFTSANVTGGLGANTAFFNLLKANTSNTGVLNASNASVSNLLCSNLNVLTTANMVALTVTGVSQAGLIIGNASGLSNLNSSNLVGNVANANVALVVSQPAQPNITSLGVLNSLTISGILNSNLFTGNASGLSNINGSNVSTVPTAQSVVQAAQTNITSVGTLTGLTVQGILNANLHVGNASGLSNINSSNLVGNVAQANVALVVSQPAQPNITSVGTLTGLNVSGVLQAGLHTGNASGLSNINGSNVSTVPTSQSVIAPAQPNITSVGTLTGLVVSGILNSNLFTGNASGLSNINGSNVSTVPTAQSVTAAAQTNITSVGTLTSLSVQGILSSNLFVGNASGLSNINSSNLVGNVANANVALVVSQPLQPNITRTGILTSLNVSGVSNLGDVYATGFTSNSTNTVFNFDTLTIPFLSATTLNVSSISNIGTIYGQGNGISNVLSSVLLGNVANANVALVASQPAQPNITSVGTLTSLSVQGILSSNLFVGNASGLSNINGANVSTVPTAQSVTVAAQTNITSVGTLTSLIVSGILNSNLFTGNASGLSNLNSSNLVGNVANANVALVVSQASQPNITSVGTLTGLTIAGILNANLHVGNASALSNINGANVSTVPTAQSVTVAAQTNITSVGTLTGLYSSGNVTATFFTGQGNGLTNVISSVLVGNVANANVALVVSQPFQPNITQVGTLTGLYSSGNVTASFFSGQGNALTNLQSSILVGNVAQANVALVVSQPAQPNITSVGTLTSLNISGTTNTANLEVSGALLSNASYTGFLFDTFTIPYINVVSGLNVSGVSNLTAVWGSLATPAQPNITSVGTLTSLSVQGILSANLHVGNASALSNINGANVSTVPTAQSVTVASQPNITSVGTLSSLSVQGISSSNLFVGNASALSNVNGSNVSTVPTSQSVIAPSQTNITSVGTLTSLTVSGQTTSGFFTGSGNTLSNLTASNVTIGAFSASQLQSAQTNITSVGTLTSLTVSGNSNLQTLNVASIATPGVIPVSSGLFMNLNATYTLNATGNWTGNIAGSITSNLFTLFSPNPVASWTTYGSNPLITGPTANGGFRFNQTGPYQFTVVLTSDNNIKTIALSSNTSDVHSNLADPGVWLYCYRISVGQDPSVPVQIPFFVDSTSKYYFIDYESVKKTAENIHKTAYTNVVAEGYTGSYVTLRPL